MNAAATPIVEPSTVAAPIPAARQGRVWAFVELTKPGITRMVLLTTAVGFYMAASVPLDLRLFLHMLVGTGFASAGANALNQYRERGHDALMRRTARRPLPAGRLSAREALGFSLFISVLGIAYVLYFVGVMPALLVAASLATYIGVYTPLKRLTPFATEIGAVPGALPILAGWTAGGGAIGDVGGWILFAILFLWQLPHFFSLAWVYRDDYTRGGFRIRSTIDVDGHTTAVLAAGYAGILLAVSLLPSFAGLTGALYLAGAVVLGTALLALSVAQLAGPSDGRARRLFLASIVYLPLLLALLVIDRR